MTFEQLWELCFRCGGVASLQWRLYGCIRGCIRDGLLAVYVMVVAAWKGIGCHSRHDAQWCEQTGLGVYHDGAKRIRAVLALFVTPEDAGSCAADNAWFRAEIHRQPRRQCCFFKKK